MTTKKSTQTVFLPSLKRFLPIVTWLPSYDRTWLCPDILARFSLLGRVPDKIYFADIRDHPEYHTIPGMMIIRIDEGLFFANGTVISEAIEQLIKESEEEVRAILIDLELTDELDFSAIEMLTKLHALLSDKEIRLLLSRVSPDSRALIDRSGLTDMSGSDRIYVRALGAIGDYLEEEDIPIKNLKDMTTTFVNNVIEIYLSVADRSDEVQREELNRIVKRMNELSKELNSSIQDES